MFTVVISLIEILISPELFTIASEGSIFVKGEFDDDNSNVAPGVPVPIIYNTPLVVSALVTPVSVSLLFLHITIFFGGKRVFVGFGAGV